MLPERIAKPTMATRPTRHTELISTRLLRLPVIPG